MRETLQFIGQMWNDLIANVIALPIAYWGIHQWLESFAYRTQAEITLFAGTGLLTPGSLPESTVGFLILKIRAQKSSGKLYGMNNHV